VTRTDISVLSGGNESLYVGMTCLSFRPGQGKTTGQRQARESCHISNRLDLTDLWVGEGSKDEALTARMDVQTQEPLVQNLRKAHFIRG